MIPTSDPDMPSQPCTKALHSFPDSISKTLETISQDLKDLRTAIEYSRRYNQANHFLVEEIDQRILSIQNKTDMLQGTLRYTDALA